MNFYKNTVLNKWMGFLVASVIVVFSIWMITSFVGRLKEEEALKVQNYVQVQTLLITSEENTPIEATEFYISFLNTVNLPIIILNEDGSYNLSVNIDKDIVQNKKRLKRMVEDMESKYPPFILQYPFGTQKLYYKNSELLDQLQLYPIILVILIALFGLFTYWYYQTVKHSEQNYLWAGMAKETAHQIGTPISSLIGWLELLKMEDVDPMSITEMQKDVDRLTTIAERFSKIGSKTELESLDIVETTQKAFDYMSTRLSKNVSFYFQPDIQYAEVALSEPLFGWVFENLIKNAVDAMQGKGEVRVHLFEKENEVFISVKDTGHGIPSSKHKEVFKPGYTTKKRGWGLGLSLAKRIIEEYHGGKIFVYRSSPGKGTEFRIILKTV